MIAVTPLGKATRVAGKVVRRKKKPPTLSKRRERTKRKAERTAKVARRRADEAQERVRETEGRRTTKATPVQRREQAQVSEAEAKRRARLYHLANTGTAEERLAATEEIIAIKAGRRRNKSDSDHRYLFRRE